MTNSTWLAELANIRQSHAQLLLRLEAERVKGPPAILSAFTVALSHLQEVAVFVAGDFDARIPTITGTPHTTAFFTKVQNSFSSLQLTADSMLKEVSKISVDDIELKNAKLAPLQNEVDAAKKSSQIRLDGIKTRIETQEQTVREQREAVTTAEEAAQKLEEKYQKDERAQQSIDIGVSILCPWFGIAGAINKNLSPGHVILGSDVGKARQALQDAVNTVNTVEHDLSNLEGDAIALNNQMIIQQKFLDGVDSIVHCIEQAKDGFDSLVQGAAEAKKLATKMAENMDTMAAEATTIGDGSSYFKAEFVAHILSICHSALIEPGAARLVKGIVDELLKGYKQGPSIPEDIEKDIQALNQKADLLTKN